MRRLAPVWRLAIFIVLAVLLGYVVQRDPGQLTLDLPDRGISVTVPRNLEGWRLEPGTGDVLVQGRTRLGLIELEIAAVPAATREAIDDYIAGRHEQLRPGRENYIVWHQGLDSKFGGRNAPAYKATYMEGFGILPIKAEWWINDVYWPHQGRYVRITTRYPDRFARYVEPDRIMLAAGLRLAKQMKEADR